MPERPQNAAAEEETRTSNGFNYVELKRFRAMQRVRPFGEERPQGKSSRRVFFLTRQEADINPAIVLEPGRSLWKLNGATFSAKQSSVAMIQQKDGEKPIGHPRRSINRTKKPHRTQSTRRHGGCTRGAIKSAAYATFGMDERERQKPFYPDLHGECAEPSLLIVVWSDRRAALRSDGSTLARSALEIRLARFQNAIQSAIRIDACSAKRAKRAKCIFHVALLLLFIYLYALSIGSVEAIEKRELRRPWNRSSSRAAGSLPRIALLTANKPKLTYRLQTHIMIEIEI